MEREQPRSLAHGVNAAAPYSARPPSPPYIHVSSVATEGGGTDMTIRPSLEALAAYPALRLTRADLDRITQGQASFTARDTCGAWQYEDRRGAQRVLDFMYLGPSSVARDAGFLRRERITMLLCVRDVRLASVRLVGLPRRGGGEGSPLAEYVDVASNAELVAAFPEAVRSINAHLLAVPGGRVLVCCETGNYRSAAIVVAYLMLMFGLGMNRALQFVSLQRFCINMDDEIKHVLWTWEDLLRARRDVARGDQEDGGRATATVTATAANKSRTMHKRRIGDIMDLDDEGVGYDGSGLVQDDGWQQRRTFTPFVDSDVSMQDKS